MAYQQYVPSKSLQVSKPVDCIYYVVYQLCQEPNSRDVFLTDLNAVYQYR